MCESWARLGAPSLPSTGRPNCAVGTTAKRIDTDCAGGGDHRLGLLKWQLPAFENVSSVLGREAQKAFRQHGRAAPASSPRNAHHHDGDIVGAARIQGGLNEGICGVVRMA